jgi:DNA-binding NtrC family response regulator
MRRAAAQVAVAAGSALGVCLQGERGTGKEHFARLIHYQSPAGVRSFVPLDCSIATAMELKRAVKRLIEPEEDETIAPAMRPGTLYLKHVEKFPRDLQETIVEAFTNEERQAAHNLRLIVSTTADLATLLSDEALREDFYYLVSTLVISLPRLVERMSEFDLLAQHFLEEENRGREKQVGGFAPAVLEQFHKYSWPGNLDELQTVVKECWTECRGEQVELDELPFRFQSAFAAQSEGPPVRPRLEPLESFLERVEREQIEEALRQTRYNKTKAADVLGIPRPKLYRRMEALGIEEGEGV